MLENFSSELKCAIANNKFQVSVLADWSKLDFTYRRFIFEERQCLTEPQ